MADSSEKPGLRLEVNKLGRLMELMAKHDVSEVQVTNGDDRIRLRRGVHGAAAVAAAPVQYAQPAPAPVAPAAPAADASAGTTPSAPADETGTFITSPEVGTFYSRPDPETPVYVKVGDKVTPQTVVCLIEQMKVFNQIEAGVSGVIEEVLVNDGDTVEFGTNLFRIRPA